VHVLGDARAGPRRGEGDGLGEDAGHQELAVDLRAGGAADVQRAAEHVREQHHEHDRLDQPEDDHLGDADHADQVALGDDQRVADGAAERVPGGRDPHGFGDGTHFAASSSSD
jgi:hypothetical protein